jgi:hypothetical protein
MIGRCIISTHSLCASKPIASMPHRVGVGCKQRNIVIARTMRAPHETERCKGNLAREMAKQVYVREILHVEDDTDTIDSQSMLSSSKDEQGLELPVSFCTWEALPIRIQYSSYHGKQAHSSCPQYNSTCWVFLLFLFSLFLYDYR